jgi:hypothetical protein
VHLQAYLLPPDPEKMLAGYCCHLHILAQICGSARLRRMFSDDARSIAQSECILLTGNRDIAQASRLAPTVRGASPLPASSKFRA